MRACMAPVPVLLASLGRTAVKLVLEVIMARIVPNGVPAAQESVTQ